MVYLATLTWCHAQTTPSQEDEWGSDDDEDDEPEEKCVAVGDAVRSGMMLYAFTGMCASPWSFFGVGVQPKYASTWGLGFRVLDTLHPNHIHPSLLNEAIL